MRNQEDVGEHSHKAHDFITVNPFSHAFQRKHFEIGFHSVRILYCVSTNDVRSLSSTS